MGRVHLEEKDFLHPLCNMLLKVLGRAAHSLARSGQVSFLVYIGLPSAPEVPKFPERHLVFPAIY